MRTSHETEYDLEGQSRVSLVIVVGVGYLVTFLGAFSSNGYQGTLAESLVAILLGVIYTLLCLYNDRYFEHFTANWSKPLFFTVQIGLVFAIQWLIGPGAIWLVSLPLAVMAVEWLRPLWRWPVYLAILFGLLVPIGFRYQEWQSGIYFAISVSPAIFFVVVFTEQGIRERAAREKLVSLTTDLEAANRKLAAYAAQIEDLATIQERNRLAREIHDDLGHYLTVVNVQIGAAKVLLASDTERAMTALDKAQTLTQEGLTAVRQSVSALRGPAVGQRPLPEGIAALAHESNNAGIVTEFAVRGAHRPLALQEELTLYRAAQEGLTNIRKHACASRVDLTLDYSNPEQVRLVIVDNGLGATDATNGFGLLGIRERVQVLGGDVKVKTAVNQGFTLQVTIPTT